MERDHKMEWRRIIEAAIKQENLYENEVQIWQSDSLPYLKKVLQKG